MLGWLLAEIYDTIKTDTDDLMCLQDTWYVPPSRSKIAGGKLCEKLRNTWRQIKLCECRDATPPTSLCDAANGLLDS